MSNVYFIGAGPFGENLLTREGYRILKQADCVLYDHLLDEQILNIVQGECIYVGKQASHHHLPQAKINALLIEKARQYQCVVRLKGGDSVVFARGAEEALALKNANISFSFIPGVSSCIAAAELAGIPLTCRGIASGFQVISAHLQDHEMRIEEAQLANPMITLIFLMGLSRVSMICDKLLQANRDVDTPIAIISQAASPQQKVVTATLSTILAKMAIAKPTSPAVIVVGEVVKLREQLQFYEMKPLYGKHVMVRKIGDALSPLTISLRQAGAKVTEVQVGQIQYIDVGRDILRILAYKTILFTSKYGIEGCFQALDKQGLDARIFHDLQLVVLGNKVAKKLKEYGLRADIIIEGSYMDILANDKICTSSLLHIKASQSMLDEQDIDALSVYENRECEEVEDETVYDAICFSSASSVFRYRKNLQDEVCISIGESTSKALRAKGATHILQALYPNYESMKQVYTQEVSTCTVAED